MVSESTPLFAKTNIKQPSNTNNNDKRIPLFLFLEAKTPAGLKYESFTIILILISVLTFILSSLFLPEYNTESTIATKCGGQDGNICDAVFFGNYPNNALSFLNIGATSITEIFIVFVFSIDYILRIYTADLIDVKYSGFIGRLQYIPTFFSLVDLASTVPFYVDAFLLPNTDIAASNFLRMFRLLRMMKVEGRFDLALGLIDDVFYAQRGVLGTALFVGMTVWGVLSSFFYLAERKNVDMIYCGGACDAELDTSLCTVDEWGIVDCSQAGCENLDDTEVCWNLYRSIVDSSFWTLTNLFGEFPLIDQHGFWGKILATFTAVFAVAVFALPVGVVASGFEDQIAKRREQLALDVQEVEDTEVEEEFVGDVTTFRGRVYNILHQERSPKAKLRKTFTDMLIIAVAISFIFDSVAGHSSGVVHQILVWFQFFSFLVFAGEYILRMYSAGENPKYRGSGLGRYAKQTVLLIDAFSIFPYLVGLVTLSEVGAGYSLFLLFKIFHVGSTNKAFATFGNVIKEHKDVLTVTGFSAVLLWIFFSSILYYTERDSPDEEMKTYYNTIPNSMWITLLNLSGESPLAHYSSAGKVIVGIIGLFATAVFGIPIGLLGAGFEEHVTNKYEDTPDEEEDVDMRSSRTHRPVGFQR